MARRDLSDLAVVSDDGSFKEGAAPAEVLRPVDLRTLKDQIRAVAKRKAELRGDTGKAGPAR